MSRHLLRLIALLMTFALFAAACGDDDTVDDATDVVDDAVDDAEDAVDDAADEVDDAIDDEDGAEDMAEEDWPEQITFGFVPSQDQATLQDNIQPFIEVLEESLGIGVEGFVTTDYTALVTSMGTDQTDLGAFGPFGYTLGVDEFGNMEALIQSIRFGSATYHGQWLTNDPSICNEPPVPGTALENVDGEVVQVDALEAVALQVGVDFDDAGEKFQGATNEGGDTISPGSSCIGDLSAVEGATVAFTSESSTSGYLFPALQLSNMDIDPETDITPVFTGGHDGAVTAVYNGDASIGLSFDDARSTIADSSPDVGEEVIVFNITDEIPNDVVAVRSELPDSLKQAIYDAIEDYLATDEGAEVFESIYEWTDIRPADEADFDIVREAAASLGISEPPE